MTSWLARSVAVSWAPAPLRSATRSCPRTGVRAMPPVRRVTWWSRARASLGIERVVAHAPVDRPASGRLLAKAGFTCHSPSVTAWWRLSGPRARAPGWVVMLSAARPKGRPHGLPVSFAWQGAAVVCAVKGGRRPSRSEDPGRLGQRRRRRGTARGAAGAAPAGRHRRCRGRGGAVALLPQRPAAGTGGSGAGGVPDGAQERRRRGAGDVRGRDRGDDPTPGGGRRSTAAQVQRLGGHSLRAGFVTEAFRRGADAHAIIRQTGTGPRSPVMLEVYARDTPAGRQRRHPPRPLIRAGPVAAHRRALSGRGQPSLARPSERGGRGLGYVARPRHRVELARRAGSHDLVRAVARLPTLDPVPRRRRSVREHPSRSPN